MASAKKTKTAPPKTGAIIGFEATLWQAADEIRNNMDATECMRDLIHALETLTQTIEDSEEPFPLAKIRDALLPRLLSGELTIPNAERIVGAAT